MGKNVWPTNKGQEKSLGKGCAKTVISTLGKPYLHFVIIQVYTSHICRIANGLLR